ncbi:MAG: RNA 2',3'-cyclic phosphodiesterase [Bacteroidia bacterium]
MLSIFSGQTTPKPHRHFIGFPRSPALLEDAAMLHRHQARGLRWVEEQNLHLTVYFFGKWEEEALPNLKSCIGLVVKKQKAFSLHFRDLYLAPKASNPRMIWARYEQKKAFVQLATALNRMFSQLQPGHQFRNKPMPHITLARLKGWEAGAPLPAVSNEANWKLHCDELVLWQSELSESGAVYTELGRWRLE